MNEDYLKLPSRCRYEGRVCYAMYSSVLNNSATADMETMSHNWKGGVA